MVEPIREALAPLSNRISLALIYGSVAKGTASASSDVDLLVVADDMTLERLYTSLEPAESSLDRKINPTLYTKDEFEKRRCAGNEFLRRILAGEHLVLIGDENTE